jgi:hypothetical protein
MSEEQLSLLSISSAEVSPARICPQPGSTPDSMETEADSGTSTPESSTSFARAPSWSKMCRRSLQTGWTSLSVTSSGAVTASLVVSSKLPTSGHRTSESDSSSWPTPQARDMKGGFANHTKGGRDLSSAVKWPTPRASDGERGSKDSRSRSNGPPLPEAVAQWPTPTVAIATGGQTSRSGDRKDELLLAGMVGGGKLNPDWVEVLMGLPIGWTDGPADPETLLLFGNLREL